ncbi:MAG: response regulator [Lawsonibacter sp.]|nr:response regulator [Lawsonibacter sp.]
MPGGFFIYHAGGRQSLLYANTTVLRIFGCETMEEFRALTGNSFRGMVHPDDLEEVEKSIWQQIARSQYDLDYVEYRIIRKDGGIRWIEDYGHFVRNKTVGDIFYVFMGDATEKRLRQQEERAALISEKVQKEQSLQSQIDAYYKELEGFNQSHLQHMEVIEGLSIDYNSIFYADLDEDTIQTFRISNRAEFQLWNDGKLHPFTGFAGPYLETWVCPEDRPRLEKAVDPVYIRKKLTQHKTFHINYRAQRDGTMEYLQWRVVNVSEAGVSQVVIGIRSVDGEVRSELKRREVLENALREANSAVSAKTTFLSNMSHDLRTPMNAIMGFTSLAKRHLDEPRRAREYLDAVEGASGQLLRLINNVLELSNLENGQDQVENGSCDLRILMEELYQGTLPQAQEKGLELILDLSQLRHPVVLTDRQKLSQLLTRLTDNAVQYTQTGRVSLTVEEPGGLSDSYQTYHFAVEDTGVGIAPDFLPHIFEPFGREKNTTLAGTYGTGLGLTIAQSLAERLGGTVEAQSTPGKGSRFTAAFLFRAQDIPSPDSNGALSAQPAASSSGRRILVVEDNELNREIAAALLEDAGFQVDMAENGRLAVERVQCSKPGEYALILMDIQMPEMDGCQAARAIRALEDPALSAIPIVALSANAFEEDRRNSIESGMNEHLPKPVDADRLLELIDRLLGHASE